MVGIHHEVDLVDGDRRDRDSFVTWQRSVSTTRRYPVYPQTPILGELTTGKNIASEQGWAFLCAAHTKGLLSVSCAQQTRVAGLPQAAHTHGSGSLRTSRRTDVLSMRPSRAPVRSMVSLPTYARSVGLPGRMPRRARAGRARAAPGVTTLRRR